jgi:hypothetical protein
MTVSLNNTQVKLHFYSTYSQSFIWVIILETCRSNWDALIKRGGYELTVSAADSIRNAAWGMIRHLLLQNLIDRPYKLCKFEDVKLMGVFIRRKYEITSTRDSYTLIGLCEMEFSVFCWFKVGQMPMFYEDGNKVCGSVRTVYIRPASFSNAILG